MSACGRLAGFDEFSRGADNGGAANGGVTAGGSPALSGNANDGARAGIDGTTGGASPGGASAGAGAGAFPSAGAPTFAGQDQGGASAAASGGASRGGASGGGASGGGASGGGAAGGGATLGGTSTGGALALGGTAGGGEAGNAPGGAAGGSTLPSCRDPGFGKHDCGPSQDQDCCTSLLVPGGTYDRDGDRAYPATISSFRLDRYEATMGRFRAFVAAAVAGYRPLVGSGQHTQAVNGHVGSEQGWLATWNQYIDLTLGQWEDVNHLHCPRGNWEDNATALDNHSMVCIDWYEAYAFCIWDGGFLPTYEEWNYATLGGSAQRQYPWGSAPLDPGLAVYDLGPVMADPPTITLLPPVGSKSPQGDGRWGHSDLLGDVWELTLSHSSPETLCVDCAGELEKGSSVGAGFLDTAGGVVINAEFDNGASVRYEDVGVRCARAP